MASGLHFVVLLCLTSGLWMEANARCRTKSGDCCEPCPPGWTLFGSRCFTFNFNEKEWTDAEISCIDFGGNLASFKNIDEYKFLRAMVKNATGIDKSTWIGGYDAVKNGVWHWSDGSKFGYKNWGQGEPNNAGKGEHCMEINFEERDHVNDMSCDKKRSFICAKDP